MTDFRAWVPHPDTDSDYLVEFYEDYVQLRDFWQTEVPAITVNKVTLDGKEVPFNEKLWRYLEAHIAEVEENEL